MENKFTREQTEKARECKNVEELLVLAKENGIELSEAEAKNLFAQLAPTYGELSDSELEEVAGGCGGNDGDPNICPKGGTHEWVRDAKGSKKIVILPVCRKCGKKL